MAYLPKSIVEKNIRIRVRRVRGKPHSDYEAYLGTDPFTHRPMRITRASKDDLEDEIVEFYKRHRVGGDAAVRLNALQSIDAKSAMDALAAAGMEMSLNEAVARLVEKTCGEAVRVAESMLVGTAYKEYFDGKPEGAHKSKIESTVGKWAGANETRKLATITAKEVADYLKKYEALAPKTYNSHLEYLKMFFNWCAKEERGYLAKSPISSLLYREEPWEEPEYMKPEDVERLFRLLESHKADRPEMLAYAVVSFFCGSRAIEIQRMASDADAAKINIEDETIRIAKQKGFQRGRRPRAFHIEPTALAWMKSFDFAEALGKVTRWTQNDIYLLAREKSIPVFQNCGRHTFITMHVAAYGNPMLTQAIVGTSAKMRADNYCGLASKREGEAYFAIMPTGAD